MPVIAVISLAANKASTAAPGVSRTASSRASAAVGESSQMMS